MSINTQMLPNDAKCTISRGGCTGYIFGGILDNLATNALFIFNSATAQVSEVISDVSPPPRTRHAITLWNSSVLVYGGKDANDKSLNDLWLFHPSKSRWRQLFPEKDYPALCDHACVCSENTLYIIGTEKDVNSIDCLVCNILTMYAINLKTGVLTTLFHPSQIPSPAFALSPEKSYHYPPFGYMITDSSIRFYNLPCQRSSPHCFISQNRIILFGGDSRNGEYLTDIWYYDIINNSWGLVSGDENQQYVSIGAACVHFPDFLVFFGGLKYALSSFNLRTKEWNGPQLLKQSAYLHHCCLGVTSVHGSRLISLGGYSFPVIVNMNPSNSQSMQGESISQYDLDTRCLIKDMRMSLFSRIPTPLSIESIEISSTNLENGSDGDESDMGLLLQNSHCTSCKELVSKLVQGNTNELFVLKRVNNQSQPQPQPPSTPRKEECSRPLEGFLTPNLVSTNHLREFSDPIREFHSDNMSPPLNDRGTFESTIQKQLPSANQVRLKDALSPSRQSSIPRFTSDLREDTPIPDYKTPIGKHRVTFSDMSRIYPPTDLPDVPAYPPPSPSRVFSTPKVRHESSLSFSQTSKHEGPSPGSQPLSALRLFSRHEVYPDPSAIGLECSLPPPPPLEIRSPKDTTDTPSDVEPTGMKPTTKSDMTPVKFSGLTESKQSRSGHGELRFPEMIPDVELESNRSSISVPVDRIVTETEEERLFNETVEALKKVVADYTNLTSEIRSLENRITDGQKKTKELENELSTPKKMFGNSKYSKYSINDLQRILNEKLEEYYY